MHEYETIFIVRPDLSDEDTETVAKAMEGVLADQGATLVKSERWGRKRLAYRVQRHWEGTYIFFEYKGSHASTLELERRLRIHDGVIKFLSVRKDPRAAAEEERKAARLAKMQKAESAGLDGEERYHEGR